MSPLWRSLDDMADRIPHLALLLVLHAPRTRRRQAKGHQMNTQSPPPTPPRYAISEDDLSSAYKSVMPEGFEPSRNAIRAQLAMLNGRNSTIPPQPEAAPSIAFGAGDCPKCGNDLCGIPAGTDEKGEPTWNDSTVLECNGKCGIVAWVSADEGEAGAQWEEWDEEKPEAAPLSTSLSATPRGAYLCICALCDVQFADDNRCAVMCPTCKGKPEAAPVGDAMAALSELVRLKRLRDKWAGKMLRVSDHDPNQHQLDLEEYERLKPAAWVAAFAVVDRAPSLPARGTT